MVSPTIGQGISSLTQETFIGHLLGHGPGFTKTVCVCVCVRACACACVSCSVMSNSLATPWTVASQASAYWSGLPFPSPGELPNLGIEPHSPASQADS